ncbi:VanZ family protein [Spirosoma endophyticum]|uniref:VanZ like family protein n=1 Tax=Spirosoma endophyticum TaxID=662367 RepID=A0A1I1XPD0_9BACT|nr:VanZ family protein [Spirosoma endophyticum]SFE09209.1 VanZ like family protein [Spirosoma endophyticum]
MRINPILLRGLAITWTIIILIGCLAPHDEIPGPIISWNDKLMHVAIFVPFSLLWMMTGMRLQTALIIGVLFGALIEGLQYILPINRSCDFEDLVADSIGTLVGVGLALVWYRLFPRQDF